MREKEARSSTTSGNAFWILLLPFIRLLTKIHLRPLRGGNRRVCQRSLLDSALRAPPSLSLLAHRPHGKPPFRVNLTERAAKSHPSDLRPTDPPETLLSLSDHISQVSRPRTSPPSGTPFYFRDAARRRLTERALPFRFMIGIDLCSRRFQLHDEHDICSEQCIAPETSMKKVRGDTGLIGGAALSRCLYDH